MTQLFALTAVVAAAVVTLSEGAPAHLPDVALGSAVLFHFERALALLGAATAALVIVHRGSRGELPDELSTQGVKYAPTRRAEQLVANELKRLQERLQDLERRVGED